MAKNNTQRCLTYRVNGFDIGLKYDDIPSPALLCASQLVLCPIRVNSVGIAWHFPAFRLFGVIQQNTCEYISGQ
jgi:hypothetical protein